MNIFIIPQAKTYYRNEKIKKAAVGEYIKFGSYEQDNIKSNGKEDVEWLVLDKKDGKILIISRYALDCQQYDENSGSVTWEVCSLRKWLNSDFVNSAFTDDEKEAILTTSVVAHKNSFFKVKSGENTNDMIFLLSTTEVKQYLKYKTDRKCIPTDFAVANGVQSNAAGNCNWWMRTPGCNQVCVAFVSDVGISNNIGINNSTDDFAVRPAMWIG